jgi:hypothetical protein
VFLIASAAYVDDEFRAEVGSIPPAFLPLCNRRLFEFQVESIRRITKPNEDIFLSLPLSFQMDYKDEELLKELNVTVIFLSDTLTLGHAIYKAIELCKDKESVKILYGDTFFKNIPMEDDCISIGNSYENYEWKVESKSDMGLTVWSGYFAFSNKQIISDALNQSNFDYIATIEGLVSSKKLKLSYIDEWFDLGHINSYFLVRSKFTSERSFNSIEINKNIVKKQSLKREKILAEAKWFQTIPAGIKRLTPNFICLEDESVASYSIEYMYYMPLNELAVHGQLPKNSWMQIINSCKEYFLEARNYQFDPNVKQLIERENLIKHKTLSRVSDYKKHSPPIRFDLPVRYNGIEINSPDVIIAELVEYSIKTPFLFSVLHGDFCFSNIIFDSRAKAIKLIDPRGLTSADEFSIYGDITYDLAKFYHSVVGFYDFIISDCFSLNIKNQNVEFDIFVPKDFLSLGAYVERTCLLDGYTKQTIMPQVILLFFSMLPLHSDSPKRQNALLANALRLYVDFQRLK